MINDAGDRVGVSFPAEFEPLLAGKIRRKEPAPGNGTRRKQAGLAGTECGQGENNYGVQGR